eukprot:1157764-Pelagomonas_calceolata.AAC.19
MSSHLVGSRLGNPPGEQIWTGNKCPWDAGPEEVAAAEDLGDHTVKSHSCGREGMSRGSRGRGSGSLLLKANDSWRGQGQCIPYTAMKVSGKEGTQMKPLMRIWMGGGE